MKLNKILMVLAATAIVGCTTDDVSDFTANQANDDSRLVQLNPNFVLAGVGEEGNITRTHWDMAGGAVVNTFLPIYNAGAAAGQMLDVAAELGAQSVGLCWLGQVPGQDVYTNYQFYHFGWLNKGVKKAEFECNELTNGSLYSEIGGLAAVTNGAGGEAIPGTDWTIAELPTKSVKAGADNLDYNSGIYKTDNKAIFGGDYIVYYPFNEDFKDAGTIPAAAVTTFNGVATTLQDPQLGEQTFRYSNKVTIEGGAQATDFSLQNLSTLVQLKVFVPKTTDGAYGNNIDQIVLYSAKKQLYKQVKLAADKIVAGQTGADLYVTEECEGTKTITANFAAATSLDVKAAAINAFITVLPTTVEDLVILVHNKTAKKWARINKANTTFGAGKAKLIEIEVTNDDFKAEYIAVDEPSLINARNEARIAGKGTITVIGDITLDKAKSPYDFSTHAKDGNITYTGDAIIVPEDVVLNTATIWKSDLRLLGTSCCSGTNGARLNIDGGTLSNVTMEPTEAKTPTPAMNPIVTYTGSVGAATIAAGKTFDAQAGSIVVNSAVQHKGDLKIAKDVTLTVNALGDLNFMGGSVVNNGTIEVMKSGKYDMTDAKGNATANDGQRMTNNGKFIHNVDAEVGTAVQSMKMDPNKAEYRCRVDKQIKLDDALLQWTACSVIEMVNTSAENYNLGSAASIHLLDATYEDYKHNGKYIDYEVNSVGAVTTFTNPVLASGDCDGKNIEMGNLTVVAGGLNITYGAPAGKKGARQLTVHGDMKVKANTTITSSQKITIEKNLTVEKGSAAVTFRYRGNKANVKGLEVAKDIKVSNATFDAGSVAADVDALNIECTNFTLEKFATAVFGNRTEGDAKNMTVHGKISNPSGCIFNIVGANQNGAGSVYAWVDCYSLEVGGSFPGARPKVVSPAE